jgi:TPR repeat protein
LLLTAGATRARAQPARDALQAAAQSGRAEAAYELGLDYDLGTSGPEDTTSALSWYRRAAEAGLPAAEFNVAVMLDAGRGTARDPSDAAQWYAKAAAHGHARAAYDLGQLYAAGDGVPRNTAAAAAWFTQASELPAAARKLVALRADAGAPVRDAALLAPTPASPADGGILPRSAERAKVELVWTAPAEPVPVRYFVELVALGGGPARRLFAGFADVTAVLASVEGSANSYAWRVYAVDAAGGRYAASPWARFTAPPASSSR